MSFKQWCRKLDPNRPLVEVPENLRFKAKKSTKRLFWTKEAQLIVFWKVQLISKMPHYFSVILGNMLNQSNIHVFKKYKKTNYSSWNKKPNISPKWKLPPKKSSKKPKLTTKIWVYIKWMSIKKGMKKRKLKGVLRTRTECMKNSRIWNNTANTSATLKEYSSKKKKLMNSVVSKHTIK